MSLGGTPIDNDGFVNAMDIGIGGGTSSGTQDNGLLCITDNTRCCRSGDGNATGEWFFPNGGKVKTEGDISRTANFYRNRGMSIVRLNQEDSTTERGRFRCDLLGSTIYANICE